MMPPNGTLPEGIPTNSGENGAEIDIVEANTQKEKYSTGIHWDGYGEHHKSAGKSVSAPELHSKGQIKIHSKLNDSKCLMN